MKLYALNGIFDYENDTLLGVYSSAELADAAMKEFLNDHHEFKMFDDFSVEEFELNASAQYK